MYERGSVLVVEDEPVVRLFVTDVLRQLGYDTLEANDGPSGLEILQSAVVIDLLLTDIGLPGLNGRQLAEARRQTRPTLKVPFMTGYAEAAAVSDGFLAPGMELITKPFAIDGLESQLQRLLVR
jgi:CheY-like chemotaxis protein